VRLRESLMKGRKAGRAPVLISVTKCPAISRIRILRFIAEKFGLFFESHRTYL